MSPFAEQGSRWYRYGVVTILLVAGLWRALMAGALPVVARDGVTFCWYARDLGVEGVAFLRAPTTRQHPLFPAMILVVQRTARLLGAADTPLTWQRSGQMVCWLAGMAVIGLAGALAARLVRRLELPLEPRTATLMAMLLASVLDLNVWLSADVLSDQVHLALYLAAVWLALKLDTLPAALGCGVLGGLAFLTRQEGLMPVLGGLAVLTTQGRQTGWRKPASRAAVLLVGFLICAVPYWSAVGRFSTKKDPFEAFRSEAGAAAGGDRNEGQAFWFGTAGRGAGRYGTHETSLAETALDFVDQQSVVPSTALAKLQTLDVAWYTVVPHALYKLFRAGRVVIPLLAVLPLVNLRKRLLGPVLSGLTACAGGHFVLTLVLLKRYGYLEPRHTLVVVMLLLPLAGLQLSRVYGLLAQLHRWRLGGLVVAGFVLPLALYALRVPNAGERYVAEAARWLSAHDPAVAAQRLLSGSGPKRIAFYADMRWQPWSEQPAEYGALAQAIRVGGRGYFALEVGPGFEREGNRELLARLLADEALGPYLGQAYVRPGPNAKTQLHLLELRPEPD